MKIIDHRLLIPSPVVIFSPCPSTSEHPPETKKGESELNWNANSLCFDNSTSNLIILINSFKTAVEFELPPPKPDDVGIFLVVTISTWSWIWNSCWKRCTASSIELLLPSTVEGINTVLVFFEWLIAVSYTHLTLPTKA